MPIKLSEIRTNAPEPESTSPCVSICRLDSAGICVGCGRTMPEIQAWPTAHHVAREQIRRAAQYRLSIIESDTATKASTSR